MRNPSPITLKKVALAQRLAAIIVLFNSLEVHGQTVAEITGLPDASQCRYLSSVEADSGYGKKFDWRRDAKYLALHKAEKLGASHLVWDRMIPVGAFNGIAVGKAYQCSG